MRDENEVATAKERDDSIAVRLNQSFSIQEILSVYAENSRLLSSRHFSSLIVSLWDIRKAYGNFAMELIEEHNKTVIGHPLMPSLLADLQHQMEEFDSEQCVDALFSLASLGFFESASGIISALVTRAISSIPQMNLYSLSKFTQFCHNHHSTTVYACCPAMLSRLKALMVDVNSLKEFRSLSIVVFNLLDYCCNDLIWQYLEICDDLLLNHVPMRSSPPTVAVTPLPAPLSASAAAAAASFAALTSFMSSPRLRSSPPQPVSLPASSPPSPSPPSSQQQQQKQRRHDDEFYNFRHCLAILSHLFQSNFNGGGHRWQVLMDSIVEQLGRYFLKKMDVLTEMECANVVRAFYSGARSPFSDGKPLHGSHVDETLRAALVSRSVFLLHSCVLPGAVTALVRTLLPLQPERDVTTLLLSRVDHMIDKVSATDATVILTTLARTFWLWSLGDRLLPQLTQRARQLLQGVLPQLPDESLLRLTRAELFLMSRCPRESAYEQALRGELVRRLDGSLSLRYARWVPFLAAFVLQLGQGGIPYSLQRLAERLTGHAPLRLLNHTLLALNAYAARFPVARRQKTILQTAATDRLQTLFGKDDEHDGEDMARTAAQLCSQSDDKIDPVLISHAVRQQVRLLRMRPGEPLSATYTRWLCNLIRNATYFGPELLEPLIDRTLRYSATRDVDTRSVVRIMEACLNVNYVPDAADTLCDTAIRQFGALNMADKVTVALALAFFKRYPRDVFNEVFGVAFLEKVDEAITVVPVKQALSLRRKMFQINQAVCVESPQLEIPWFHEEYGLHLRQITKIQHYMVMDIHNCLEMLLGSRRYFHRLSWSPYYHDLDFELIVRKRDSTPLEISQYDWRQSSKVRKHLPLPIECKRIAVLYAGESGFCSNKQHPLGWIEFKRRQLVALGYDVVIIPYFEWPLSTYPAKWDSKQQQLDYLRKKLFDQS